jgi:hypothetical protein
MGILYQKVFTGEIQPVIINKNTSSLSPGDNIEVSLIKWRDIALKHLSSNANLSTVECEFKLEYLHFDYIIPSRVVVPSSALPEFKVRDPGVLKQAKTIDFKSKYNRLNNYSFEFRLLKLYDSIFKLDSSTAYSNQIGYNAELDYPIADQIYNNRLPGFVDLIPYLIKNGTLLFADIKQELRVMILPRVGDGDLLIFGGGYSGSISYELNKSTITCTKSENIALESVIPQQILELNDNRYGLYLCNNSSADIYYSFGFMPNNSAKLALKPSETLVLENDKLTLNNTEITPGDTRYSLGLPLWVRGSVIGGNQQISIEELSYS